MERGKYA